MVGKLLAPEIKSMIDARNFGALREIFADWLPADVAEVILDLPENDQVIIFRVLPAALAADVFEYICKVGGSADGYGWLGLLAAARDQDRE